MYNQPIQPYPNRLPLNNLVQTPILELPQRNTTHAETIIQQNNANYHATRALLGFSPRLQTIDFNQAPEPVPMAVTIIPTLSPRSNSWHNTHANNNQSPYPLHAHFNAGNIAIVQGVPEDIVMMRTVAVATVHPLNRDELLNAQSAEWKVPSPTFNKLTERVMAFYSTHDMKKANYLYIGRLLRNYFGEIHIGVTPEAFIEQNLQNRLHARYLNEHCCSRTVLPPGSGGAYDTSASGWLQWWCIVLLLPTIGLLVGGMVMSTTIQLYSFTSNPILSFQKLNTSYVNDIQYNNFEIETVPGTGKTLDFPLNTNINEMDQSLEYIPSLTVPRLGNNNNNNIAFRIHWQVIDATGATVHTMHSTTFVPDNVPRSDFCNYNSMTDSCTSNGRVYSSLSKWENPSENTGCIINKAERCETTQVKVSNTGLIKFGTSGLSNKGTILPLTLRILQAEFRSIKGEAIDTPNNIQISYQAQFQENFLSSFLIVLGCMLLFIGFFFLFVVCFFICCGICDSSGNEKIASENDDGNILGHKNKKYYSARTARSSRDDDICLQLYCMFYCCNFLPDCVLGFSNLCDVMCAHCGLLCSSCSNLCGTLFSSCDFSSHIGEAGRIGEDVAGHSVGFCAMCEDCGPCSDLLEACFCCQDCSNCDCACGALDCAC